MMCLLIFHMKMDVHVKKIHTGLYISVHACSNIYIGNTHLIIN